MFSSVARPFVDVNKTIEATTLNFAMDASRNHVFGFGCVYDLEWTGGQWKPGFIEECQPSIQFLELYAVCVGIFTWRHRLTNGRFMIWCDNQPSMRMLNNGTSSCKNGMNLLKLVALDNLKCNRRVFAQYIETDKNTQADAISRMDLTKFFKNSPTDMSRKPCPLPSVLWPVSRICVTRLLIISQFSLQGRPN